MGRLEPEVMNVSDMLLDGSSGVLRGFATEQLNANFVMLEDGETMPSHRNDEVDVVVIVQAGEGTVVIDGEPHLVSADSIALIPRGTVRSITADRRLLYFTIHQRRDGVVIDRSGG